MIFDRKPELKEGEMTTIRASLVCTESLADRAATLGLGEFITLGRGAEKQGERTNPTLLEDVFEAVTGAIYLDGGFDAAHSFVQSIFADLVDNAAGGKDTYYMKDYKSRLQTLAQTSGPADIRYGEISVSGPDHERTFVMNVLVDGEELGRGCGRTKKSAEQEAAKQAVLSLIGTEESKCI
jgi:ribonuclease-3